MKPAFKPRDSQGVPIPVLPAEEDVSYSQADWDEETFALFAEGRDPPACPKCGRIGFYGPRVSEQTGRHRACRFCGFFQRVDGPVERATPTVHRCGTWPTVARAPYLWWVDPGRDAYVCVFCEGPVSVDASRVQAPADEPQHPWWKVPQARTRFYYARFWENWPFTKGRVFL